MFESLKKKFSRTSEKLEEELIEEAEKEDNLQEESGKRFSFFSFGRKKEEKKEEEDESNLIPETTEETEAEETEETKESDDGVKEEKKSRFWSRSKDESDDEEDVDESDKDADDTEDEPDVEEVDEPEEEVKEEKKSRFWSGSKDESDDEEDVDEPEEEVKEEKKSRFWSRSKDESDDEEDVDEPEEEVKGEKKSHFWSRSKDKSDDEDSEDKEKDDSSEEKKSHFWSRSKDKSDKEDISADGEATGGLFSFVREKTISEKHVEDILWELEMELLQGDVAMEVATEVVDSVKNDLVGKKIKRSNDITEYTFIALRNAVSDIIDIPGKSMTEMIEEKKAQGEPLVVMFVGINGTGKTTTIGKLANYYLKKGYTPVIAASDTFRAGAIEQVTYHADNVGVKIIKHKKGSDPAAVAFDAVEHAKAQGKELVLIDTAGRMQTNVNLMDEMKKIKRVANPDLVIFVGDALTGNDATEQAIKFNDAIDIDGVILTKADADSKGGASLSIGYVIQKPIMFLGVGQGYDDIKEYDAEWMLDQLFSESEEAEVLEE
ncbi:signal recognition particle-docking protein FtsY [uncultured Methanobrevibacter sp.]|uniref:signal recognition particle-docking protein FtsY n=1 Tax=uncultured Methanobrevibacter sp. TaxID=253161 RepID=UPI0025D50AC2|nr:signal recognition particle-docking protein FtsY [uncultured Methanobrevibacter sp.]